MTAAFAPAEAAQRSLAEIAWTLTQQSRRAWSFETEARPFGETW